MRARRVLAVVIAAGMLPALTGLSAPEITQPIKPVHILDDPRPPHRFMASPIDAAVLDVAPKATKPRIVHKPVVLKATGGWAQGNWSRFPASVEISARCIAHHESWNAGLWRAKNGSSSASGFAQWLDGIWRVQAKRAGVGTQYARAYLAPPDIQASVFAYQAMHYGLYPWHGTNCPGT